MLLSRLPPESATWTAIRDGMTLEQWQAQPTSDAWGPWSHTDHLLAEVADRLAWNQWTLIAVNSEKGQSPKPPERVPRPGVGGGPLAAVAVQERRERLMSIAVLKAREEAQGAKPSPEAIESWLDALTGGSDE